MNTDDLEESQTERKYREIVGSLVYAMTCTRPDLSWVVTKLSQHLSCPTKADWITVNHVLRYIKGSIHKKLTFTKSRSNMKLIGLSDSDWASCKEDRRSTTGYVFYLNSDGPAISWKSRKQPTVALSSCEAEYMALTATTQEAIFLSNLMKDFGIKLPKTIPLYGDNQGAIALVKNPVQHNRSKHIDIKFHFIREKYMQKIIEINYIPTNNNIADLFTKPITKSKLELFEKVLFGIK